MIITIGEETYVLWSAETGWFTIAAMLRKEKNVERTIRLLTGGY